jgi:deoxyribodipyrimidine photolyase
MQQSVRMACACLLTEYLGLSWTHGAAWFHDTLVDAVRALWGLGAAQYAQLGSGRPRQQRCRCYPLGRWCRTSPSTA